MKRADVKRVGVKRDDIEIAISRAEIAFLSIGITSLINVLVAGLTSHPYIMVLYVFLSYILLKRW